MSGEPPVFGENGAVMNSETMTDDWRAKHAAGAQQSFEVQWVRIIACNAFIVMTLLAPQPYWLIIAVIFWFVVLCQPFVKKASRAPLHERVLMVSLLIPLLTRWLEANGYLSPDAGTLWFGLSLIMVTSLHVVYFCCSRLLGSRLK